LSALGLAQAQAGDFESARKNQSASVAILRELGHTLPLALRGFPEGICELLAGEPARAELVLRESCDALERIGESARLSTLVCWLGEAFYELDRVEDAQSQAVRAEQLGAPDDLETQILWRRLRAKVRARQGRAAEAAALGREAVAIAEQTQGLVWQADALSDLGEVLEMAGEWSNALQVTREALRRYERKGLVPRIRKTTDRIAGLEASQA
jgi:tetratricopeptide (TPR) repeat protein